jgi:hypothetical protein
MHSSKTTMHVNCLHPSSPDPPQVLMIPEGLQYVVTIANAQSHYVVLHFDLNQNNVLVYDGLQYDTKTWQPYINRILTMLGDRIVDSGQWNVIMKTCVQDDNKQGNCDSITLEHNDDGWNCGPIVAICLWALYDFNACFASINSNGSPSTTNDYRSVVISHLTHLLEKHDSHLPCHFHKDIFTDENMHGECLMMTEDDNNGDTKQIGNDVLVSPTCKEALRDEAFTSLQRAAKKMKSNVEAKEKPINVGDVVQFSVKDIDKNKTDPGTLTVVVIGIDYKKRSIV